MTPLTDILDEYERQNIKIFQWPAKFSGTIEIENEYAVFTDFFSFKTSADLNYALGHELGHCVTGATHSVSSELDLIRKHEYRADKFCAFRLVPPDKLRDALKDGVTRVWELAERFELPEWFIAKAWEYYSENGFPGMSAESAEESV